MFCSKCGSQVNDDEAFCGVCGNSLKESLPVANAAGESVPQNSTPSQIANPEAPSININLSQNQQNHAMGVAFANPPQELKSKEVTGLLCIFLGWLGIHDFYVGKTTLGVVKLVLTCLVVSSFIVGIWVIIDLICILSGSYCDRWGRPLTGNAPLTKFLVFLPFALFILLIIGAFVLLAGDPNFQEGFHQGYNATQQIINP